MRSLLIALLLLSSTAFSQQVLVKEVRARPRAKFYNVKDTTIIYPLITTKNTAISKSINEKIRTTIFDEADEKTTLRKDISHALDQGLINLSYEVTFKKNGILSLSIYKEACGAYCDSYYTYFNFDLRTGESFELIDLVDPHKLDSFSNIVLNDKTAFLKKYKEEEKGNIGEDNIDTAAYEWIIEQVDNCMKTVNLNEFILSGDHLEIRDPCEFPHVIRSQEPTYELKYSYSYLSAFLKPAYRVRLLK